MKKSSARERSLAYMTNTATQQAQTVLAKKRFKAHWETRSSYLMMAPFLILFSVFTIAPILASIFFSFTSFNMLETPRWVGFNNYIRLLLDDQIFLQVFKNTLVFAFITGPISYVLSFLLAWMINEYKPTARSIWTLIFYAPDRKSTRLNSSHQIISYAVFCLKKKKKKKEENEPSERNGEQRQRGE